MHAERLVVRGRVGPFDSAVQAVQVQGSGWHTVDGALEEAAVEALEIHQTVLGCQEMDGHAPRIRSPNSKAADILA